MITFITINRLSHISDMAYDVTCDVIYDVTCDVTYDLVFHLLQLIDYHIYISLLQSCAWEEEGEMDDSAYTYLFCAHVYLFCGAQIGLPFSGREGLSLSLSLPLPPPLLTTCCRTHILSLVLRLLNVVQMCGRALACHCTFL